ncbi:Amino acid adenylation domain-containing protein [Sulfidibacter corallicola]|uniref:Amino acid adenylation domain-containing protein n=1 Tax=Sulfidibacter corallicola TaxID=2818388 RepID=A0A8A4TSX5_SULCO|nr:amino acid adenylation domain-containing protein [Sulfidibacter corallicola]QTD52264.1 amino acid adenylation domain-containing protein [Sulfidibacter corallicola]
MKTLAERVAALTPQQRQLLLRAREKRLEAQADDTIPPRTGPGPWPACADQAALWFFQQIDAHAVPYNIGNGQRLFGPLDHAVLETAYRQLVRRQEMLRARYPIVDGVPHVDIADDPDPTIEWVDVRHVPPEHRERAAEKEAARLINRPFDLEQGPIVRFVIIRVAEEGHLFVPVMHHSITDAISYNIFFRELIAIYWGLKRNKPVSLPPLTRQYVDYGLWRNRWLESDVFREQLEWWHRTLAGAPTVADVPGDYPRPEVFSYRGNRVFFTLGRDTTQALRALNRRAGTTSLMTLLAASYALFYRYAGLADLLIAVPASHREHREMTHVIGYFLNYVPFRGRVTPGMSFTQLLAETRTTVLGGLKHKRVPFSSIVERVKPDRDPSRMPLAQLGFVYVSAAGLNTEAAKLHDEAPPFRIEGYYADREISPMDLQLIFMEGTDEVTCFLEYASDIYKPETMEYLTDTFRYLCQACLSEPDRPIDGFPLMGPIAAQLIPKSWNPMGHPTREVSRADVSTSETLHGRFEAQSARSADTVAVSCEGRAWSYDELDRHASAIAGRLLHRGITAETGVAVCIDPSPEGIAALLGVLKAGATYVPIAADFPQPRRQAVLAESRAAMVLVTAGSRDLGWDGLPILIVDEIPEDDTPQALPTVDPRQAAYILHTSGSTGKPKAVMGTHLSLLHRLSWITAQLPPEIGEPHVLHAPMTVNESLTEIFQALHHGGTLIVAPEEIRKDPVQLISLLAAHRVRRTQMVPPLLRLLLARPELDRELAALRLLILQGEPLPADLAHTCRRLLPNCTPINNYGLTEATGSAGFPITETAAWIDTVPVGFSQGGVALHLLDGHLNPLPPGAVGELYLSGPALARGYAGRPGATAERFIPDPNGNGTRLFRTGDRARFDPAHGFTILGRVDRQIKIRGNRVEPEEVEATLRLLPAVEDAAVLAKRGELIGFVQSAAAISTESLRAHLLGYLPDFMVPTAFVCLTALPQTAGGKIDRRQLSETAVATQPISKTPVAPRGETEKLLVQTWAQVLGHPTVGIDDDFFELGGHSLKAAEIVARLHRDSGREVPLALLFQTRTIRRLAETLDRLGDWHLLRTGSGPALLHHTGRSKVFAFPPMLGFAMVYRPLAERLPDLSLYGFDFTNVPDPAERYADHIEAIQPTGPLKLMGYSAGGNLAFETAGVLEARGRTLECLVLIDSLYRKGPAPNEHDILERRAAFLVDLERQLRSDPVMGPYAEEPYLQGLIRKTPGAFYLHHHRGRDQGQVAAPIDYIRSGEPDPGRDPARAAWAAATTGTFREHRGDGAHDGMLQGEALTATSALLAAIMG